MPPRSSQIVHVYLLGLALKQMSRPSPSTTSSYIIFGRACHVLIGLKVPRPLYRCQQRHSRLYIQINYFRLPRRTAAFEMLF